MRHERKRVPVVPSPTLTISGDDRLVSVQRPLQWAEAGHFHVTAPPVGPSSLSAGEQQPLVPRRSAK